MKIARVFPRKTEQSPMDILAFDDIPPKLIKQDDPLLSVDEVHISCSFSYDMKIAEFLALQWETLGKPVKLGGPAYGDITTEFVPGRYLKHGVTITSTGCPNKCWHCDVWKRVGNIKELDVKDGYIIQDDNFLACSHRHKAKVIEMLKRQKERPEFKGGLEAKLLTREDVGMLQSVKPLSMFFAYDTPDDYEPLVEAGKMIKEAEFTIKSRIPRAYVLIGYPKDTLEAAEKRCIDTLEAGFIPFAMLYCDRSGKKNMGFAKLQRQFDRIPIIYRRYNKYFA